MMVGLMKYTPTEFRGRVMGFRALAIYGLPLGLVLGGWIAEQLGVQLMLLIQSALGLALTMFAVVMWPALFRSQEDADSAP